MKALVTGATGFIGGRLAARLAETGAEVRCLVRDAERASHLRDAGHQLHEGDVLDADSLTGAGRGVDVAYYLIHSMGRGGSTASDFEQRDRAAARNFARMASEEGIERVVYLGGLGDESGSRHLRSRHETATMLGAHGPPLTYFRAAMVVGAGSESYRTLRYLVARLPVMIAPSWLRKPTQPIGIDDVLDYFEAAPRVEAAAGREVEIGGPDVLSYQDMVGEMADALGKRRPPMVPVPLLTPTLSSLWIGLVTPVDTGVARPLVEGLSTSTVVEDRSGARLFDIAPNPLPRGSRGGAGGGGGHSRARCVRSRTPVAHAAGREYVGAVLGRKEAGVIAVVAGSLLCAAAAEGASVSVDAEPGASTMRFVAAPGETNSVAVDIGPQQAGMIPYVISDAGAPVAAGAGCTGGGPAGSQVTCLMAPTRPPCGLRGCIPPHSATLEVRLGDADDLASTAPVALFDSGSGPLGINLYGEDGADTLVSGPAGAALDPGPGNDTVAGGRGSDSVEHPILADGADLLDLGDGTDSIKYSAVTAAVTVTADGLANDGLAGEADNLVSIEAVTGGSGDDVIAGSEEADTLTGGLGADLLLGGGGGDFLDGDRVASVGPGGDDTIKGGAGRDNIEGDRGSDRLRGGSGKDYIKNATVRGDGDRDSLDCGSASNDLAVAEEMDKVRHCEKVVRRVA